MRIKQRVGCCVDLKSSPALNSTLWGRKGLRANYQQSVSTELHGLGKRKSHQCGKKGMVSQEALKEMLKGERLDASEGKDFT